jgi:hypothetical protein
MYCATNSKKAKVSYINEAGAKETFVNDAPIDVSIKTISYVTNCWRFFGIGDDGASYELFASGQVPSYTLNTGLNSRGYIPTMDGHLLASQDYYYVSGYGYAAANSSEATPGYHTSGSCNNTSIRCQIIITNASNNIVFTDYVKCPGDFSVTCDDNCPEGYCRIECPHYPGYCCLNENTINSLITKLK